MRFLFAYILFQFIFSSFDTLAIINDRVITKNDFLKRAEYTIRPNYCKSNNNIDKKIILNSLIAEKLFAIENSDHQIKDQQTLNSINGIKEQAMRRVLLEEYVNNNLVIDNNKTIALYEKSQFRYDVNFIILESAHIGKIGSQDSFVDISSNLNLIPNSKELSFFNCFNDKIFNYFYYDDNQIYKGDLIGPILLSDNEAILIDVSKKKKSVTLNSSSQIEEYKKIQDYYVKLESSKLREELVLSIMSGKQIIFKDSAFLKLANYYHKDNPDIMVDPQEVLFTLDGGEWTINDLININDSRPLVFRDSYSNKSDFYKQFKLALVDLVRDFYLTDKAFEYGYDNHPAIIKEVKVWEDYMLASDMRNQIVSNSFNIEEYDSEYDLIKNILSPKSEMLFKKYSDNIVVDVDMFNEIRLSSIDMVVINVNQPYQLLVPLFPKLTIKNNLNY